VIVIVRGTKGDHTIQSPSYDTASQAQAEMQKIRQAQKLYDDSKYDEVPDAMPDWLIVDLALVVSVSVSGSG
jgi:hypothetical protein